MSEIARTPSRDAAEFDSSFEPLLGSDEAAQLLKIHPKTLQRMARQRQIPGIQIGKLWRFRRSELNAWIEKIIARGGAASVTHLCIRSTAKGTVGDDARTVLAEKLDPSARRGVESKCDRCQNSRSR